VAGTAVLPLDFLWTAPESCPTQAEVVQQLSKAVDVGEKELPPLTARAVVTQDGAVWRLELTTEVDGRRGTRLLEADSCEGLSRAATLVLALTFGEGLARRQAEAEARAAEPTPPPPPEPAKPPPPSPPPPAEPPRWQLWAASAIGTDALGGFGPALAAGLAVRPSLLRLGLRIEATFPRSTPLVGFEGNANSYSFSAGLQACVAPAWSSLQLAACADVGATLLRASGEGTARDQAATIPLYGAGPGFSAAWLFHRHAFLQLGVSSRFFFEHPELVVEGLPQTRRVELSSFSGELGAGARW
jgi:hypothetical protein